MSYLFKYLLQHIWRINIPLPDTKSNYGLRVKEILIIKTGELLAKTDELVNDVLDTLQIESNRLKLHK